MVHTIFTYSCVCRRQKRVCTYCTLHNKVCLPFVPMYVSLVLLFVFVVFVSFEICIVNLISFSSFMDPFGRVGPTNILEVGHILAPNMDNLSSELHLLEGERIFIIKIAGESFRGRTLNAIHHGPSYVDVTC